MANSPEAIRRRVIAQMKAAKPVGQFVVSTIQNIPIVNFGNFPRDINLNSPLIQAQCKIEIKDIKLQSRSNRRRGRYLPTATMQSQSFLHRPRQGIKTIQDIHLQSHVFSPKTKQTPNASMPIKVVPGSDFHRDLDLLAGGTLSPTQFKAIYQNKKIAFLESERQHRPNTTGQVLRHSLGAANRLAQDMKNSKAYQGQTKEEIFSNQAPNDFRFSRTAQGSRREKLSFTSSRNSVDRNG